MLRIVRDAQVGSAHDGIVDSISNITEIHEPLCFDRPVGVGPGNGNGGTDPRAARSFGIWSIAWSGNGQEVIAGSNDASLYVYDIASSRVVARVEGHDDDVNSVDYLTEGECQLMVTGSDDTLVKVWDRRLLDSGGGRGGGGGGHGRAVGVFVGHSEGVAHVSRMALLPQGA